ncbi:MAG: hypothetical protein JXR70_00295 [Spirochaetales bacterium]|nr:hypothetical protein [Spirochaetales bacterium]
MKSRKVFMKGPVLFNKQDGTIRFNLPEEAMEWTNQLGKYLQEAFAYESLSSRTVREMNRMAISWLQDKGIQTQWENDEETSDGN